MKFLFKNEYTRSRGFTLIEMLVSVALFSIVMTIVAAAYLNLLNLDRQAKATNDVSASLNFVTDTMARLIRTGTNYACNGVAGTNCAYGAGGPQSTFSFKDDQGNTVTYSLDTNAHQIMECYDRGSGCTPNPINDPRINISTLNFYVQGVGAGDSSQPQVTFVIQGSVNVDPSHAPVNFTIQTSATQRQIDL